MPAIVAFKLPSAAAIGTVTLVSLQRGWQAIHAGPGTFAFDREAKLIHARWAMLGPLLTPLAPELMSKYFGVHFGEPV